VGAILKGDTAVARYFVNAQTLAPLDTQNAAAAQKWVDSSISEKPSTAPKTSALTRSGCLYGGVGSRLQGCTEAYRPNDCHRIGFGPSLKAPTTAPGENCSAGHVGRGGEGRLYVRPLDRPRAEGSTYKIKWPDSEHALYITINDVVIGGPPVRFRSKCFINSKKHGAFCLDRSR